MTSPEPSIPTPTGSSAIRAAQEFANSRNYPTKANFNPLVVDGVSGPLTINASTRIYQYFASVTIDGKFGPQSKKFADILRRGHTSVVGASITVWTKRKRLQPGC